LRFARAILEESQIYSQRKREMLGQQRRKARMFFSEEKNQKTFASGGRG
jgi:hypothetical protein